jgi:hypothetical protein
MINPKSDLLQGTLDMLILKALSLGSLHGYGIIQRIRRMSDEMLTVEQGALYPALYRIDYERETIPAFFLDAKLEMEIEANRESGMTPEVALARLALQRTHER